MHSHPEKLRKLLENCDYKTCTAFFYAGDMMNYMATDGEHPYSSFIDTSVELFASSIPFELVRGNHETRGALARHYPSYFPKNNDKIYGSYLSGDIMVIMLDTGEDKEESHWAYSGLTDFNAYRTEQARWLETVIKSKEYKKARYHIVISHFPMVMGQEWIQEKSWWGWQDAIQKFMPILNKANIDLLVSGHTHRFYYHKINKSTNNFPILEQGYMCATRLDISEGLIHIKVVDTDSKTLFTTSISTK